MATSTSSGMIPSISSTDGTYCGAPCTSSYNPPISNQCTQSMQSQDMYVMPMVQNNNTHNGHYISESPHMLMQSNNNYDPNMFHSNEYSPDSSYSENSDYTTGSEEYENENADKTNDSQASAVVNAHEMYQHQHQHQPHHQSTYASNGQNMHAMSASNSCASSNTLPPFPSINSNCGLSMGGGVGGYKEGHCHPYQESSAANSMHLNHYNSYSAMTDNLQQQAPPLPSQHSSLYSYDIHSSTPHYANYSNNFHKEEPNFAPMRIDNVAVATSSHLTVESSSPVHQQQQQVNCSSTQVVESESNNIAPPQAPQQQYIDLSLSIASSSSAESLLSAANTFTSDEDSRLTPVSSFTHPPLSSSSSFYTVVTNSSNLSQSSYPSYSAKEDHHLLPQCSVVSPFLELSEADPKSSSSSSDSSSESNLSSSENFGEIIKKSIVETVSA